MSPLAHEVYVQLVRVARTGADGLSYAELAERVSVHIPTHHRSSKLHGALTEVTRACRRAHLPCLPALVWRAATHRPAPNYFAVAHPRALTDEARLTAWQRETARLRGARFPATLEKKP